MHETSIAQRMVETAIEVADQNGGGRVVGMHLLLGEMTCVEPETLSFAFEVASRGTRVEGCPLEIVRVPTRLRCRACGAERGGELLAGGAGRGEPPGGLIHRFWPDHPGAIDQGNILDDSGPRDEPPVPGL